MDVELLVLMRHRRRLGRSGWRKPVATVQKTGETKQTFEVQNGRMRAAGEVREHHPRPNHHPSDQPDRRG